VIWVDHVKPSEVNGVGDRFWARFLPVRVASNDCGGYLRLALLLAGCDYDTEIEKVESA